MASLEQLKRLAKANFVKKMLGDPLRDEKKQFLQAYEKGEYGSLVKGKIEISNKIAFNDDLLQNFKQYCEKDIQFCIDALRIGLSKIQGEIATDDFWLLLRNAIPKEFFLNREFVKECVTLRGSSIQMFPLFQDDDEICQLAVIHSGQALQYVYPDLSGLSDDQKQKLIELSYRHHAWGTLKQAGRFGVLKNMEFLKKLYFQYPDPFQQMTYVDFSYLRQWEKERKQIIRLREENVENKKENELEE